MERQAQKAARALAAGRIVVGASLCAAPSLAAQWAGDDARSPGARMIVRALGVRDAALGVGAVASAQHPGQLRRWLVAGSACDAADFAATLAGPPSPARTLVLALAAAATATGLVVAAMIER